MSAAFPKSPPAATVNDSASTLAALALQTVQTGYGHFGAGRIPDLLDMLSPDVDWRFIATPGSPYADPAHGPQEVGRWFEQVMANDDIQLFEPREFFAGPGHVTVVGHERTRDRQTGREFETPWIHLFQIENGRITRFLGAYDTAAVEAVRP